MLSLRVDLLEKIEKTEKDFFELQEILYKNKDNAKDSSLFFQTNESIERILAYYESIKNILKSDMDSSSIHFVLDLLSFIMMDIGNLMSQEALLISKFKLEHQYITFIYRDMAYMFIHIFGERLLISLTEKEKTIMEEIASIFKKS